MSAGLQRKVTPEITYERPVGPWECFRVHGQGMDRLDRLLFLGELREFFLKADVFHHVGDNWRQPYGLPPNPGRVDFFVVIEGHNIPLLRHGFEIAGFSPELVA